MYNLENIGMSQVLSILLLVSLGIISLSVVSIDYDQVEQSYYANSSVIAVEDSQNLTAGIDAGQNLHFGEVTEGTNVTKTLNIESPRMSLIRVNSNGNISQSLEYDGLQLFKGNHSEQITMIGESSGYYEGDLTLNIKIANNEVTRYWLQLKGSVYS